MNWGMGSCRSSVRCGGPGQSGKREVLVDGLPGFPDGVGRAAGGRGGFWIGLTAPTQPVVHLLPWLCAHDTGRSWP